MKKRQRGLTLIELMVACAVVAILASVAYPSYQSYARKSRRAEGQSLLQAAQLAQEKYRINNASYAGDFSGAAFAQLCKGGVVANCLSAGGSYRVTVDGSPTASSYTLTATGQGSQAKDTSCATMQVVQDAQQLQYLPAQCWSR